jgi:uncharacterized protein YdhG (YjbR/CyaY superfamily)
VEARRLKAADIDSYIAAFPPAVRARLRKMRVAIRRAAPDAREKISYRIPTFALCGNLVHFAGYEHHIGFYPGASGVKKFAREENLARYAPKASVKPRSTRGGARRKAGAT